MRVVPKTRCHHFSRSPGGLKLPGTRNSFPVKIDANREIRLTQALAIDSYPTVVLASAEGKIIGRHVGYADYSELSTLLAKAPSRQENKPNSPPVSSQAQCGVCPGTSRILKPRRYAGMPAAVQSHHCISAGIARGPRGTSTVATNRSRSGGNAAREGSDQLRPHEPSTKTRCCSGSLKCKKKPSLS